MCFSNCVENEMKLYILHLHLLLFFWWVLVGCFFLCVCLCVWGFFCFGLFFWLVVVYFFVVIVAVVFLLVVFFVFVLPGNLWKNRSTDLSPSGLIERSIYTREKLHFCNYCWGATLLFFFFFFSPNSVMRKEQITLWRRCGRKCM